MTVSGWSALTAIPMMTSNRLAVVYEADELLVAMAYGGDGNRVFQLNYNLHTDEDWKANSGN